MVPLVDIWDASSLDVLDPLDVLEEGSFRRNSRAARCWLRFPSVAQTAEMSDAGESQRAPEAPGRETAERLARQAAQSGKSYHELLTESTQYASKQNWCRAARACREAIALAPDKPRAYFGLGAVLCNSGHYVEGAQRFLEAAGRFPVGSEDWAEATAKVFEMLRQKECAEVVKPEWWNDEGLKALSARVVRAAPNEEATHYMRAHVLSGFTGGAWEAGPRSAAELKEAAAHFDRSAALYDAPAYKALFSRQADLCRSRAEAL